MIKSYLKALSCLLLVLFFSNALSAQIFTAVLNTKAGTNASCPDGFGNMYVGGIFANTTVIGGVPITSVGDNDAWIGKYDAAGNFLWSVNGGGTLSDKVWVLKADSVGDVYAVMHFNDTISWGGSTFVSNGATDFLVTKISSTGSVIWSKQIGSPADENGNYVYLDLDNNHDVHVLTYVQSGFLYINNSASPLANASYNLVSVKLSGSTGNLLNVNNFGYSQTASIFAVNAMRTDKQGNIYAVYFSNAASVFAGNAATFGNVRGKVNANGSLGYIKTNSHEAPRDIAIDGQGNMTITGSWDTQLDLGDTILTQSVVSNDIFVVHYNANGNRSWFRTYGGFQTDYGQYCLQDAQGNLVVVGIATGQVSLGTLAITANGADFFILKMDTSGTVLSATTTHAANDEVVFSAGIDASDNIVITGGTVPPTSFGQFVFTDPTTQYFAWMMSGNACQSTGKVFRDFNNDGVLDVTDAGLLGVVVQSVPGGNYAMSGQQGDYQIYSSPGTYTLSVPNVPLYHTLTTNSTQSASFTSLGQIDSLNHFGFYPTLGIRDLVVSVISLVSAKPGHIAGYLVTYKNVGTDTVTTGTLSVSYPSSLNFFTSYPATSSSGTNTLTWNIGTLLPGASGAVQVYYTIPTNAVQGTVFVLPIAITSPGVDQTPSNNSLNYNIVTVSSFDPNSKEVSPSQINQAYVNNGGWFNYTIHFQNTGNDTAFNVLLRDTLSNMLNMGTFEVVGSSHPVSVSMKNGRVIEFLFQNINLPDSNVNSLKSHGVVSFRIKANTPSPITGVINNFAAIYFDYNAPVVTNNAPIKIMTTGVGNVDETEANWMLYPNPANDEVNFVLTSTDYSDYQLQITDLSGRIIGNYTVTSGKTLAITTSQFVSGIYLAHLSKNGINAGVQKLIIVR